MTRLAEIKELEVNSVFYSSEQLPNGIQMPIDSIGTYIQAIEQSGIETENNDLFNNDSNNSGFGENNLKKDPRSILSPNDVHEKMRRKIGSYLFYRGESRKNKATIPTIFRSRKENDTRKYLYKNEKKMYQKMLSISPELHKENFSIFDKLAIMQHHGVPTRLLDLTSNPFDALFFAVSGNDDNDGFVQIFKPYPNADSSVNKINYPYDNKVSILSALSLLSFKEQCAVVNDCKNLEGEDQDILKGDRLSNGSKKLYSILKRENAGFEERIKINDLFNPLIVIPNGIDSRILSQKAAFLLMGLSKGMSQENTPQKLIKSINEKIMEYRVGIHGDVSEKSLPVRFLIKKKYKEIIRTELNLIGINAGSVYTDMNNKIVALKDLFYEN